MRLAVLIPTCEPRILPEGSTVADTKGVSGTDSRPRSIGPRNELVKPEIVRVYPRRRHNGHEFITYGGCCDDGNDTDIAEGDDHKNRFDPPPFEVTMIPSFG